MKDLSRKQQAILTYIERFLDENDYPPTIRDIQTELGISSMVDELSSLSRWAILSRYPGDWVEPTNDAALAAVEQAAVIVSAVRIHLREWHASNA